MTVTPLPDLSKVQRVLIIRLSSIGDVAHALPVAAMLKDSYPHLEITWVVEEMSAEIVTGSPDLAEVIVIPRNRWKRQGRLTSPAVWREYFALLRTIRQRRFDVSLDLQGYAKSALMALASGAPYRLAWNRLRDGSGLISKPLPARPESVHRVEVFLDVPAALGAAGHPVRFPLFIPDEAASNSQALLSAQGIGPRARYAVINPSVGSPTRKWSSQNYGVVAARLAEEFGLATALVGSVKDAEACSGVVSVAVERVRAAGSTIADLCGQTSIKELAAVLRSCSVHICGDTGSAHIAAALGRPVVALYGPTDPAYAGPWRQEANVLARREFCIEGCGVRSCAVTGGSTRGCSSVVARCLAEITPDDVLTRVGQVIDVGK